MALGFHNARVHPVKIKFALLDSLRHQTMHQRLVPEVNARSEANKAISVGDLAIYNGQQEKMALSFSHGVAILISQQHYNKILVPL